MKETGKDRLGNERAGKKDTGKESKDSVANKHAIISQ